ncbi:MAG: ABC transporter permease [Nitrososphaerales archaeon]
MAHGSSIAKRVVFYVAIIVVWQGIFMAKVLPEVLFPSPLQVIDTLVHTASTGELPFAVGTSLWRLFAGFALSVVGGVLIGLYMARYKTVYETLGSLVLGLQSIPSIAWVPVGFIWFGLSDAGILFVIVIGTIFSMAMSTYSAIRNIPPIYIRAARNMGAKGVSLLANVVFPAALPHLVSGMRHAWGFAWRALLNAEVLFSFLGLGFMLSVGRELFSMAQVISVMIVIMVIGLAIDLLIFSKIEKTVETKWGLR